MESPIGIDWPILRPSPIVRYAQRNDMGMGAGEFIGERLLYRPQLELSFDPKAMAGVAGGLRIPDAFAVGFGLNEEERLPRAVCVWLSVGREIDLHGREMSSIRTGPEDSRQARWRLLGETAKRMQRSSTLE